MIGDSRRPIWEWARAYVGDPDSWLRRGQVIRDLLTENGMRPDSRVLDVGCGNLSEGVPLIDFLDPGNFVGVEPNGWLVEAALAEQPRLLNRQPVWLWRTDFDASSLDMTFDFVVSHSVLSHCAHWQLDQYLANTRKVVDDGAVMLASYIEDQYNSFAQDWTYPGVTTFRLRTIMAAGWHFGWHVEQVSEYRERMMAECPNDTHQWLRLTACESTADLNARHRREEEERNDLRLEEEALQAEEQADLTERQMRRVAKLGDADLARIRGAGMVP